MSQLFSFKGKVQRLHFFVGTTIAGGIIYAIDLIPSKDNLILELLVIIILISTMSYVFSLIIRRLHDLGRSGWWSLLIFIPIVNFILGLYLQFIGGVQEPTLIKSTPVNLESTQLPKVS